MIRRNIKIHETKCVILFTFAEKIKIFVKDYRSKKKLLLRGLYFK